MINREKVVSTEEVLAGIKKMFPDVMITIVPGMNKGTGNPKKVADMKKILSKVDMSILNR